MTKKVVTVYGMLFLFAFTFALSFTLTNSARADGGNCCIISMCPPPSVEVQEWGHLITLPKGGFICDNPGGHPCDWTYQCGPVP